MRRSQACEDLREAELGGVGKGRVAGESLAPQVSRSQGGLPVRT